MNDEEKMTALAREYARECDSPCRVNSDLVARDAEDIIRWLLRRYCLVEKSKAVELCGLALEHDDSVDHGLIDGLADWVLEVFPEQYHQTAKETEA